MALTKPFQIAQGVSAPNAYIRIEAVNLVKGETTSATIHVYPSQAASTDPIRTLCYGFDYSPDGENPIKQAYLHLKTLPEFEGAIDC